MSSREFAPWRRFTSVSLQETYDWFRKTKPDPEQQKGCGAAGNAYYVGRVHPNPARPFAKRGSIAYAAWAAGIDEAHDAALSHARGNEK